MANQAKQLKIATLRNKDEFHPGGFIFTIIDNDGTTILREWWDSNKELGIQFCRNWLKLRAGEEIDFMESIPPKELAIAVEPTPEPTHEPQENKDAESKQVG